MRRDKRETEFSPVDAGAFRLRLQELSRCGDDGKQKNKEGTPAEEGRIPAAAPRLEQILKELEEEKS